jgi:imidazolonepropionase-like amidohydrolase
VVRGGKISNVVTEANSASIPPNARYADFPPQATVVPAFMDLSTGLGFDGASGSISLGTNVGNRLSASDPAIAAARKAGIGTALLVGTGNGPKPILALKLSDQLRVVKEPVAIAFEIGTNLTSEAERIRGALKQAKSYHESWIKYESDLVEYEKKKKEYDAAKAKAEAEKKTKEATTPAQKPAEKQSTKENDPPKKNPPQSLADADVQAPPNENKDPPKKDEPKKEEAKSTADPNEPKAPNKLTVSSTLEPFRDVFRGKTPVVVSASRWDAIKLAITIFRDEFGLKTILAGAEDAYRNPEFLSEKQVSIIVGPELVRQVEFEQVNVPLSLALRGLPIGFQSKATSGSRQLPSAVQFAVHKGLGTGDALVGLTSGPAGFLGLNQTGAIEPGKDADLVVLSGPPFGTASRVLAVMIDGEWVYRAEIHQ